METEDQPEPAVDWRKPQVEELGLQRYLRALRNGAPIIALTVVITTLVAGLYVATSSKRYEAEADLLVSPTSDAGLSALSGLIRSSSDPTRDVETASRLVTAVDVAERVRAKLKLDDSAESLLRKVRAEPVAGSNIVAITAEGDSPERARDTANGFGRAIVQDRTEQLHAQATKAIARLKTVSAAERGTGPGSVSDQLTKLQQVLAGSDPTLTLETRAVAPTSPVAPRPALSIAAGILSGLLLGIAGVFALQALDPRLRREEQLQSLYRLPVLARIPDVEGEARSRRPLRRSRRRSRGDGGGAGRVPLAPQELSLPMLEAYRTLRITLAALRGDTTRARARTGARSLLVTSPSNGEGKSTVALNLAESLARAGSTVVLIEADLHRPSIARALGIAVQSGTGSVLLGTASLADALLRMDESGRLRLLLSEEHGASVSVADRLFLPEGRKLITTAKQMADYVVIDAPPLTSVIDALPLAQRADEVLIVVRLGTTQLAKLRDLGDLLHQHAVTPAGFVTVGAPSASQADYRYADADAPALDWLPVKRSRRQSSAPDAVQAANGQDGEPQW
jgi:Mrp family chromosome partitioning ATPase/capsular polysaccharide biosynthesis protein